MCPRSPLPRGGWPNLSQRDSDFYGWSCRAFSLHLIYVLSLLFWVHSQVKRQTNMCGRTELWTSSQWGKLLTLSHRVSSSIHPSTQSPGEQSCWPILNYNLILLIKIYSSRYLTSEDFADVDVCTKLDSNQPTMRPPKPLGWNTEKESSGGFLAASPLASLHDYHFVWKHSFCSQLQDKKKVSSPYYAGNDRLLWQKAHVWPADLLLYYLHHWCQSKWVLI